MEAYKSKIEKRRNYILAAMFLSSLTILVVYLMSSKVDTGSDFSTSFILGFQTGIFMGVEVLLLKVLITYRIALSDPDRLKLLEIKETDERNIFIQQQIGLLGFYALFFMIAIATIISGFFNLTVFFTLLGVLLLIAVTKFVLKIYTRIKY